MQWRTIIFNPENWAVGEHAIKDVMLWAISDMPWLHVRTFSNINFRTLPVQLKTKSWTSVEINETAFPTQEVLDLSFKIKKRIEILQELHYRLEISQENLGISNSNLNLLDFYRYLVSKKIIEGSAEKDSIINFENKIQVLQELDNIKNIVIGLVLNSLSEDDYRSAKTEMERLFFTNILL